MVAVTKYGVEIPFVKHLGFDLELMENGESILAFTPLHVHTNSYGVTHGGVCMTLLDVTMAAASRSMAPGMGVMTIEMKTSFMRPSRPELGPLRCKGRLMHRTKSMAFAEATIYDGAGEACAHATGTFRYVPPRADQLQAPAATD